MAVKAQVVQSADKKVEAHTVINNDQGKQNCEDKGCGSEAVSGLVVLPVVTTALEGSPRRNTENGLFCFHSVKDKKADHGYWSQLLMGASG